MPGSDCYRGVSTTRKRLLSRQIIETIDTVCVGGRSVLLLGDFNLPEIVWKGAGNCPEMQRRTTRAWAFCDMLDQHGLRQHVSEPTRGDAMLDLVVSNLQHCTCEVDVGLFESDHLQTVVTFFVSCPSPVRVTRSTALNYRRADFPGLKECLRLLPWNVLDDLDVDDALELFYQWVDAAIADFIPTVTLKSKFPPWFDGDVKQALREKESAHRQMKRSPTAENCAAFSDRRSRFKSIVSSKYRQYILHLVDDFKSNSKRFWSLLKSIKSSGRGVPALNCDGRIVTDDTERAECFSRSFAAKFSDPTVSVFPDCVSYGIDNLNHFTVMYETVHDILLSLNVHKACGPDGLSARILSECADELAVPMTKLCDLSLRQGKFPTIWKRAHVAPVFKKGDRKDPTNYRPVSLLSICSKILERVVCNQLVAHVAPVLSPAQHGFMAGRSCETNLTCFVGQLWDAIAGGHQTDVIYTDYSSAFTSVNHSLLLHKLHHSYHLSGSALRWFESYLCEREQRVVLNGKTSGWAPVESGVPEGSICGPVLFILFCNDAPSYLNSSCLMYADDMKIFRQICTSDDAVALQTDFDKLSVWSTTWKLKLNPAKCKMITFTLRTKPVTFHYVIHGVTLERVSVIRDLGVLMDSKLTFGPHVDSVVRCANRALGMYLRSLQTSRAVRGRRFRPAPLITGFNAHVRSIMEFGSVVWAGAAKTHLLRLERVQHKMLMWLATHSITPSLSHDYHHLLSHFGIPSVRTRLLQRDFTFLHSVFSGRINSAELVGMFALCAPARRTRGRAILSEPTARVETIRSGLFCRLPRHVNALYERVTDADLFSSRGTFRASVRTFLTL